MNPILRDITTGFAIVASPLEAAALKYVTTADAGVQYTAKPGSMYHPYGALTERLSSGKDAVSIGMEYEWGAGGWLGGLSASGLASHDISKAVSVLAGAKFTEKTLMPQTGLTLKIGKEGKIGSLSARARMHVTADKNPAYSGAAMAAFKFPRLQKMSFAMMAIAPIHPSGKPTARAWASYSF